MPFCSNSSWRRRAFAAALLASLSLPNPALADNWPHWRGPHFDGSSDATSLPIACSPEQELWRVTMPGPGSGTPIIWGDRVFVSSASEDSTACLALCLDRDTGKILWQKTLITDAEIPPRNTMASCSPAAEAGRVCFLYGTSDLFMFDFDGNALWRQSIAPEIGKVDTKYGYSASPLLLDGRVYTAVLRGLRTGDNPLSPLLDDGSCLFCFDAATGKLIWKSPRTSDASDESLDSYSSPLPLRTEDGLNIFVAGGNYITGHAAATGKELWRFFSNPEETPKSRLVPSPVVAGDLIYGNQPRNKDGFAFKPGTTRPKHFEDATWIYRSATADVPSPLYYQGRLYVTNDKENSLACLDPKTGKLLWKGELDSRSKCWASPTAGDGKIYMLTQEAEVFVLAAGPEFKVLSRNLLGGKLCAASIAIADNKLFVRSSGALYCFGEK